MILGLETSCDETAAAVVTRDGDVLANVVASQAELHAPFGGVVPEVAARRHLELVTPVVEEALREANTTLDHVELVAVTRGPGLVGALLVGLSAAKALAWGLSLPLAAVDHLHGHVASLFLRPDPVEPPFVCLLATGGHTMVLEVTAHDRYTVLGRTLDDAAGEAFDKGARLLGLGYPGGAELERLARGGDPRGVLVPGRARRRPRLLVLRREDVAPLRGERTWTPASSKSGERDLAASYQRAIVDALVARTRQASEKTGLGTIAIVGGVAANSELRNALPEAVAAPLALCTDNAAMIASAARWVEPLRPPDYLDLDAYASVA